MEASVDPILMLLLPKSPDEMKRQDESKVLHYCVYSEA